MALDPNEKKAQAVKHRLTFLLISLQLVTVFLILSVVYFSTNYHIERQSTQLLQSALGESKEHIKSFLGSAYRSVDLSKRLLTNNAIDSRNALTLDDYFLSQLRTNPEISGIYLASPTGDFHSLTREARLDQAGFLTKTKAANKKDTASFIWRNEGLIPRETLTNLPDDFQVLKQPWYRQAVEQQAVIWTEPYTFHTSKKPGITVAAPFYLESGELSGVIGVDIELTRLSDFLATLEVFDSVSVFMIPKSEHVVKAPSINAEDMMPENTEASTDDKQAMTIDKIAVLEYRQMAKKTGATRFQSGFTHGEVPYQLRYEPFLLDNGPTWIIGAYTPESAFLLEMLDSQSRNILIAVVILSVSIAVGFLLIRQAWKPFESFFHDVMADQLTGLFNRRFLENTGSRMYTRLLRDQNNAISIAVIGLDHFKQINQEFGYAVGNQALVAFADFLKKMLRPEDIITRYSGDTFVVVFPGIRNDAVVNVMNRMRKHLHAWPLQIQDLLIRLTFSVGVETIDDKNLIADTTFTDFIELAKKALRDAKESGHDTVISANIRNYKVGDKLNNPKEEAGTQ